jgi:hypothetical protein
MGGLVARLFAWEPRRGANALHAAVPFQYRTRCIVIAPPPFLADGLFSLPRGQYLVAVMSFVLVTASVLVHYEVLRKLSDWLARLRQLHRTRVLVLILGLLTTHIFEIWIYAAGYALLDGVADFGMIAHVDASSYPSNWLDYVYFSFITYTTVGYGDLVPRGPIRFISATEALTGWVLLGWSASFTFLEMQRFWREPRA